MKRYFRLIALVLSLICLVSIVGCQSQPAPISSEEPSSVTADLPESSQEPTSSLVEEPVSSEPSVVEPKPSVTESKPQPEASSQPEPSSVPEEPSSVAESPSSQAIPSKLAGLPTIPFEVGYQEKTSGVRADRVDEFNAIKDKFYAILIRTKDELDQEYNVEAMTGEKKAFFEKWDEAYFEENVMVCIELIDTVYTESRMKVHPVARSEDQLIVNLYNPLPNTIVAADAVFSTEYIFLSIKQSDAQGITRVCQSRGMP